MPGEVPESCLRAHLITLPRRTNIAIIGGGLASIVMASRLSSLGLLREAAILDPHPTLGSQFFERLDRIQQPVLRTPYDHHLAPAGASGQDLLTFVQGIQEVLTPIELDQVHAAESGRPSVVPVDVFRAHARWIIDTYKLPLIHYRGRVHSVHRRGRHFLLLVDGQRLLANKVVWATGEEPIRLEGGSASLRDAWRFQTALIHDHDPRCVDTIVLGGGQTAAAVCLAAAKAGGHVWWLLRNRERFRRLDASERYFTSEGIDAFASRDIRARTRTLFLEERASIMPQLGGLLSALEADGRMTVCRGTGLIDAHQVGDRLRVVLSNRAVIQAARLVVAIGLRATLAPALRPTRDWRQTAGLPHLEDSTLELADVPGAFVVGASTRLSLGPAARGIQGIRMATDRILPSLFAHVGPRPTQSQRGR